MFTIKVIPCSSIITFSHAFVPTATKNKRDDWKIWIKEAVAELPAYPKGRFATRS